MVQIVCRHAGLRRVSGLILIAALGVSFMARADDSTRIPRWLLRVSDTARSKHPCNGIRLRCGRVLTVRHCINDEYGFVQAVEEKVPIQAPLGWMTQPTNTSPEPKAQCALVTLVALCLRSRGTAGWFLVFWTWVLRTAIRRALIASFALITSPCEIASTDIESTTAGHPQAVWRRPRRQSRHRKPEYLASGFLGGARSPSLFQPMALYTCRRLYPAERPSPMIEHGNRLQVHRARQKGVTVLRQRRPCQEHRRALLPDRLRSLAQARPRRVPALPHSTRAALAARPGDRARTAALDAHARPARRYAARSGARADRHSGRAARHDRGDRAASCELTS
jgi:hypothetical protein